MQINKLAPTTPLQLGSQTQEYPILRSITCEVGLPSGH